MNTKTGKRDRKNFQSLVIRQELLPAYLNAEHLMSSWKHNASGPGRVGCKVCVRERRYKADVCESCYRRAMTEEGFAARHDIDECLFDGCEMPRANYSLCYGHYAQLRRGVRLYPIKREWGTSTPLLKCLVPGCPRQSLDYRAQICKPHRRPVWKYGLPLDKLEQLYFIGCCRVCGEASDLHIDHDHSCCPSLNTSTRRGCGKCVRGLLCFGCNSALGRVKDNPQTLRALADYLESGFRVG